MSESRSQAMAGVGAPAGKAHPVLTAVPGDGSGYEGGKDSSPSLTGEIVRDGARRMLAEALQAEVDAYIARVADERDGNGRHLVVRNGCRPSREVLPLLCMYGLSCGDFVPALGQLPGSADGLPAAVITRLTETWQGRQRAIARRDLSHVDCVRLRAGSIHVNIGLEEHQLCLLVMIGVRAGGRRELIALAGRYREPAGSWAGLLRDCARRGMRAPVLAAGEGALGFWNGLREVFPAAREGRCWYCKTASVLAALPESAAPGAKKARAEIWGAGNKQHAVDAVTAFKAACGAKFPRAVANITGDVDQLLAFCDCPCEYWVHPRTANPVESAFATVRHRTKVTKGPRSRASGLVMEFKLIGSAHARRRAVNASHLVALVRAGAIFGDGILAERPEQAAA